MFSKQQGARIGYDVHFNHTTDGGVRRFTVGGKRGIGRSWPDDPYGAFASAVMARYDEAIPELAELPPSLMAHCVNPAPTVGLLDLIDHESFRANVLPWIDDNRAGDYDFFTNYYTMDECDRGLIQNMQYLNLMREFLCDLFINDEVEIPTSSMPTDAVDISFEEMAARVKSGRFEVRDEDDAWMLKVVQRLYPNAKQFDLTNSIGEHVGYEWFLPGSVNILKIVGIQDVEHFILPTLDEIKQRLDNPCDDTPTVRTGDGLTRSFGARMPSLPAAQSPAASGVPAIEPGMDDACKVIERYFTRDLNSLSGEQRVQAQYGSLAGRTAFDEMSKAFKRDFWSNMVQGEEYTLPDIVTRLREHCFDKGMALDSESASLLCAGRLVSIKGQCTLRRGPPGRWADWKIMRR